MQTLSVTPKCENIVYYYHLFVIFNFQNHSIDSAAAAASTNMGRENVRNEINNEIEEEHAADIRDGRYHTHTYTHSLTHSLNQSKNPEPPFVGRSFRRSNFTPSVGNEKSKKRALLEYCLLLFAFCFFVSSFFFVPTKVES